MIDARKLLCFFDELNSCVLQFKKAPTSEDGGQEEDVEEFSLPFTSAQSQNYLLSDLSPEYAYIIEVQADNAIGASERVRSQVPVKPLDKDMTYLPSLQLRSKMVGSVNLMWDPPPPAVDPYVQSFEVCFMLLLIVYDDFISGVPLPRPSCCKHCTAAIQTKHNFSLFPWAKAQVVFFVFCESLQGVQGRDKAISYVFLFAVEGYASRQLVFSVDLLER